MLQQTRVAVVRHRYASFLKKFPTAKRLAAAHEHTVLAEWSGLGYYRRARSLRSAAQQVVRRRGFPQSAAELIDLPGVGRYTAAAVASIAFGEPVAVVDGNVKRVLTRVLGRALSEDECWRAAERLLDRKSPGDFNQAMMELGATVCHPQEPACDICPVASLCVKRGAGARPDRVSRRKAELRYTLARRNDRVLLRKRAPDSRLMPGMWELPERPGRTTREKPILQLRHSITTTDYSVMVFPEDRVASSKGRWVAWRSAEKLALTGLARKILRKIAADGGRSSARAGR
ncbi:MAG TPA: A/G-specific adenine glycosylase [Alphaproteobacteria bacterium]|nr:A/G-specific adenine glycosylase [Alphaproteobacteria bacterium]